VKAERQQMPKQSREARVHNFQEVALGFTKEQAVAEAKRCLDCPKKPCAEGCPVEVEIPEFIKLVANKDFEGAIEKIKEKNSLPAICGRVCPQEDQCEGECLWAKKGQSLAIGALERFVADYEREKGVEPPPKPKPTGRKVAVVGSGPAGLTAAAELARKGYTVVIFEALHGSGGVLAYGIPEFRLPKDILQAEVYYIKSLGVEIQTDKVVGKLYSVKELLEKGFDAAFISTGAGLPHFMNIPGENLNGIYSANEFLIRVNLMRAYKFPEYDTPINVGSRVVVVGGGNSAMDSARCALRLGAREVAIMYRRSREEMPARLEEVLNADEEGVRFEMLSQPIRFVGDDRGWVKAIECLRMRLGEPDSSRRRRPIPIEGSEFTFPVDTVVVAIGQGPNPMIPTSTDGLKVDGRGAIVVNQETGLTSMERVYAGGDIVRGGATVIEAMGDGKRAAKAIHEQLSRA